ncbi:MAG: class I SAM-dependent methyltransferase [Candidatus Cloacimonetes bacterium]|nr:class I SAM-dependent methyltransferase [Candidatus Cloacimonadota bacterium]
MNKKYSRERNKNLNFHIKESSEFEAKELFKDISRYTKEHFNYNTNSISVLDVGCASGELAYFLKMDLNTSGKVCGIDIDKGLIENAKKRFAFSNIEYYVDDAISFNLDYKFDVVTAISVISYFDEPDDIVKNILSHLTDNGIAFISGLFNDYGLEVRMKIRHLNDEEWMYSGWNQFPVTQIKNIINSLGYKCSIHEQIMPFDVPKKENPLRSWSVMLNNVRYNMNGLHLVYNIKILKIIKN